MLNFFIAPSKEDVKSISGMVKERLYIDTWVSTRSFVVTPNGEIYLKTVELLKQSITLRLTDQASSMIREWEGLNTGVRSWCVTVQERVSLRQTNLLSEDTRW
jgi:hypothetical protein